MPTWRRETRASRTVAVLIVMLFIIIFLYWQIWTVKPLDKLLKAFEDGMRHNRSIFANFFLLFCIEWNFVSGFSIGNYSLSLIRSKIYFEKDISNYLLSLIRSERYFEKDRSIQEIILYLWYVPKITLKGQIDTGNYSLSLIRSVRYIEKDRSV